MNDVQGSSNLSLFGIQKTLCDPDAHLPHHMERQLPISHFTLEVLVLVFGDRVLLSPDKPQVCNPPASGTYQ